MLRHIRAAATVAIASLALISARDLRAQAQTRSTGTDPRWYPWLGCWAPDNAGTSSASATCVVPVSGSRDVEMLTVARGKVIERDRLDPSGKPQDVSGQGCQGTQTVNWSASGRQAFLHAGYTCGGITAGSSATLLALAPGGGWLRIERVRSGSGQIVNVQRFQPVSVAGALSSDETAAIQRQRRAIDMARAAAAAPITTDEILDAARHLDADVVTSWVSVSGQTFDANSQQIAALMNAGVPEGVVRAMLAASAGQAQNDYGNSYGNGYATTSAPPQQQQQTMYVCPPDGCYPQPQYSAYNGDGYYNPYMNPYMSPYPYSPYSLGFAPFSFIVRSKVRNVGPVGIHHGQSFVRPNGVRPPTQPVGRGPAGRPRGGGGGGGGRRP